MKHFPLPWEPRATKATFVRGNQYGRYAGQTRHYEPRPRGSRRMRVVEKTVDISWGSDFGVGATETFRERDVHWDASVGQWRVFPETPTYAL